MAFKKGLTYLRCCLSHGTKHRMHPLCPTLLTRNPARFIGRFATKRNLQTQGSAAHNETVSMSVWC